MANLCRCERCFDVVPHVSGSIFKTTIYVGAYLTMLPYAWLLFGAGPGVAGIFPMAMFHGFAADMSLRDWAFPRDLCKTCGASLEYAPSVEAPLVPVSAQRA